MRKPLSIPAVILLLSTVTTHPGVAAVSTQPTQLRITNHCNVPIWIQQNEKERTGSCPAGTVVCVPHNAAYNPADNTAPPASTYAKNYTPEPIVQKLEAKTGSVDFHIPNGGLLGTRFWAKQGCDDRGYHCTVGESTGNSEAPADNVYAPPIDSKFEATFGCDSNVFSKTPSQCTPNTSSPKCFDAGEYHQSKCEPVTDTTWWDGSVVDGYTLPFVIQVKNDQGKCILSDGSGTTTTPSIDCSGLSVDACPTHENLTTPGQPSVMNGFDLSNINLKWFVNTTPVGCMSPCAKLTAADGTPHDATATPPKGWNAQLPWPAGGLAQVLTPGAQITPSSTLAAAFCCPTTAEQCAKDNMAANTKYSHAVHDVQKCPSYTYAYDDGIGLMQCSPSTQYEVIFCPTEADKPTASPSSTNQIKATAVLPADNTMTVLFNGQAIQNNQAILVSSGSTFSLKDTPGASCVMDVSAEQVMSTKTGTLCQYIAVNGTQLTFTAPPKTEGFSFQLGIPAGAGINPITVTLNGTPISNGQPTSAGLFKNPLILSATQNANSVTCTLTMTPTGFTKGSESFCEPLHIATLPGQATIQIDLPAAIPTSGGNGGSNNDNPPPPPPPTGNTTIQFGLTSEMTATFNQQPIKNGETVSLNETNNKLVVTSKDGRTMTCGFRWQNNTLSMVASSDTPCGEGVTIENNQQGSIYVGIPNPLPVTAAPSPVTPDDTPTPATGENTYQAGLPTNETILVNGQVTSINSPGMSFTLPEGATTVTITNTQTGKTRACVFTNTRGTLSTDTASPGCVGIVLDGKVVYFPAL